MSIWAPVVAALGASGLTGAFGFGTIWWQQRRRDRAESLVEKGIAYHQLISQSLSFTTQMGAVRTITQLRSGVREDLSVALRLRRAMDPMEFHGWLDRGFRPINDAWSKIQMTGSPEAVDASTRVVGACADLLEIAGQLDEARGKAASALRGVAWTGEQQRQLEDATKRVIRERDAFIEIARRELGMGAVAPPPTQADAKEGAGP